MSLPSPFPLSHFIYFGNFKHYYAFGNTAAEDFLQSIPVGTTGSSCPTILSLGCGDMRSCMYTLSKTFGYKADTTLKGFSGVRFVLNDCSAPVLARNILFLYICMCMPNESCEIVKKKWLASMWALWYNHELQPEHDEMLSSALAQLIQWSDTPKKWSKCRLGKFVQFSSPATFSAITKVWETWNTQVVPSVEVMQSTRMASQVYYFKKLGGERSKSEIFSNVAKNEVYLLTPHVLPKIFEYPPEMVNRMVKEYEHYLAQGTVFAESVLGLSFSQSKSVVNRTLYEQDNAKYTLHYALAPYKSFEHTFQFSHAQIKNFESSSLPPLLVVDDHFERAPLLSNSVQQFGMQVIATAQMLKNPTGCKVSFMFDHNDALSSCHNFRLHNDTTLGDATSSKHQQFDVIYTSNLLDHLSPPALVLCAAPLLKENGNLFTSTLRYKEVASNTSAYLEKVFGFPPELFPVILGMRCLEHDGRCSSVIRLESNPNYVLEFSKSLIWRNIQSHQLTIKSLSETPYVIRSLLNLCRTATSLSLKPVQSHSIETFFIVLHRFKAQLNLSQSSSYRFWEPLCREIIKNDNLAPHLVQLQTQSLLHGLHMHFIITETECPLCTGQPLESYVQHFTTIFDISEADDKTREPLTFTIILQSSSISASVAFITSLDGNISDSTLTLHFFLPTLCVEEYSCYCVVRNQDDHVGQQIIVNFGGMNDLKHSKKQYSFLNIYPAWEKSQLIFSFGKVLEHIGDAYTFNSTLSVNDTCKTATKGSNMKINAVIENIANLQFGEHKISIAYPYPIDFASVKIEVSRKKRTIAVTIKRDQTLFCNERPLYFLEPRFKLALSANEFRSHLDKGFPTSGDFVNKPFSDVFDTFCVLFKHALRGAKYFFLSLDPQRRVGTEFHKEIYHGLVFVRDVRFNAKFSIPMLDVSYCFLDTKPILVRYGINLMTTKMGFGHSIFMNDSEYSLLKKIFPFFTASTRSTFRRDSHTRSLPEERSPQWQHFDHAVIFPLYPNPEHPNFQRVVNPFLSSVLSADTTSHSALSYDQLIKKASESNNICSFCKQVFSVETLKKCASCREAQYCSKDCQVKDWKGHKPMCKLFNTVQSSSIQSPPPTLNNKCPTISRNTTTQIYQSVGASPITISQGNVPTDVTQAEDKAEDIEADISTSKQCSQSTNSNATKYNDGSFSNMDTPTTGSCQSNPQVRLSMPPTHCARCEKPANKKCSVCKSVSYCSRECQKLDWPSHRDKCSPPNLPILNSESNTSQCAVEQQISSNERDKGLNVRKPSAFIPKNKCDNCNRMNHPLKWCKCHQVSYCNVQCQRLHWPQHKISCSSLGKRQ